MAAWRVGEILRVQLIHDQDWSPVWPSIRYVTCASYLIALNFSLSLIFKLDGIDSGVCGRMGSTYWYLLHAVLNTESWLNIMCLEQGTVKGGECGLQLSQFYLVISVPMLRDPRNQRLFRGLERRHSNLGYTVLFHKVPVCFPETSFSVDVLTVWLCIC